MSFDWKEYLNLAKELAKSNDEARLRSAISRAYYSVFCKAKSLFGDKIQLTRKSIDHRLISEYLKAQDNENLKKLGVYLERLRVDRNRADYDDEFPNLTNQAEIDLLMAQKAYKILEIYEIVQ